MPTTDNITKDLQAAITWLTLGQQALAAGETVATAVVSAVKNILADHGVAADTAALETAIADAARRKAQADADAAAQA